MRAKSPIFVNLAKKMVPSVVNISTVTTMKAPLGGGGGGAPDDVFRKFFEDFFKHHGGGGQGGGRGEQDDQEDESPQSPPGKSGKMPKSMALGTGFIIDASGLILTNNHVVADADEIKIAFTEDLDEKPIDGVVVGRGRLRGHHRNFYA